MSEHLSDYALERHDPDEASASSSVAAHLAACEFCRSRYSEMGKARADALASPHFARTRRQIEETRTRNRWKLPLLSIALPAFALAAAIILWPRGAVEPMRTKGRVAIEVLSDGQPLKGAVAPGSEITLAVSAGGRSHVLVIGVDEAGRVETMWPPRAVESGPAPRGVRAQLPRKFLVTPGSFALHAYFSNVPLRADEVLNALRRAVDDHGSPLRADAPSQVGVEWTRTIVEVGDEDRP